MMVPLLLALLVALVPGEDTMLIQNQELRASGGYGCAFPWTSISGLSSDCFYFIDDRKSWDSARSHCRYLGGDLPILDTESKRRYVVNYMQSRGLRNGRSRHLGANDRAGYWRWLNGRSISSGWRRLKDGRADYEPDDDRGDDTCMYLYMDPYPAGRYDLLSDYKCTTGRYFMCEKRATDINECSSNNGGCKQTCTNTQGSFRCSCRTGYSISSDRKSCIDINECGSNNGGCKQICTNTQGSFRCSCRTGYSLSSDRKSCIDINECLSNNGGCKQTCTNTQGSFRCSCSTGYILSSDRKSCTDINECRTNNGGCNQTCTNTDGSFRCSCSSGYFLSGDKKSCNDINECRSNNGGCNQTCTNTDGSFLCSCSTGYILSSDRKSCTANRPCKAKQNCKEANGMCKKRNECSGDKIRNGCKGGKGGCVCCLDKPPPCKSKKKCREAKGVCQKASKCSGKEIKNGCKVGTGCICCVEKDCPEFCNDIYDPVCGKNEKTYSNLCELRKASCINKDVSPVPLYNGICGKDNHTT